MNKTERCSMLIYYRFNNFCSFNCESEFSMSAAAGKVKKRFTDNYVAHDDGYDLLKSAVIVGENAGGKSNFINSLIYLKSLFESNSPVKSVRPYINNASLLENERPIQKFELCFRARNKKVYIYQLHVDEEGVALEKLQLVKKPKTQPIVVFELSKTNDEYKSWFVDGKNIEDTMKGFREMINSRGMGIGLLVSKMALLGNEDAFHVVHWMTEVLYPQILATDKSDDLISRDEELKILKDDRYLSIFRMVDYSICGIEVNDEQPYLKSIVIRKDEDGNTFRRELQMDSTGVREFFAWAVEIYRVVYENKVVFADEMDRVLNPILSDRVIAFINGSEHTGQFIFSTHNVLHLDLKTYMKEQIYFITKSRDSLSSEIYSLSDFPEVRYETTKIYEFYMKGILGGTAFE